MANDRHNVSKSVRFAFAEFVVNIGLVFVTYRLVILGGGIEALGLWTTLFAWTSLIRLGDVGMANAVLRFTALHDPDSDREQTTVHVETGILANTAFFAILASLGYLLFEPWAGTAVGGQHNAEVAAVLPVMFAGFFLFNVSGVVLGAVQGLHLGYVRSIISVLGGLTQLGLACLLVPAMGLSGLAWAQIAQHSLMLVAGWMAIRHRLHLVRVAPTTFDLSAFRAMLRFGVSSQGANILNGLFEPVSKILVAHFGGLAVQALYELAYKTLWLPRNAVVAATSATIPSMTAQLLVDRDAVVSSYRRSVRLTTLAVTALSALAVASTPLISIVWIGHYAPDYTAYAAVLAFGVILNAYGAAAYNLGTVAGRVRGNLVVNGFTLVGLTTVGALAELLWSSPGLIAAVSLAMAFGGIAIKWVNEGLLFHKRDLQWTPYS